MPDSLAPLSSRDQGRPLMMRLKGSEKAIKFFQRVFEAEVTPSFKAQKEEF